MRNFCHVDCPPIDHDTPLFSMATCKILVAKAPFPAVKESPIAPTISMSPGRNVWTDFGTAALRLPGPFRSHGNSVDSE